MEQKRMLFSNNRKVSVRQIKRLLFLECFGISSLILPGSLAKLCGIDGIFAIFTGAVAAVALMRSLHAKWLLKHKNASGDLEKQNGVTTKISAVLLCALFGILGGFLLFLLTSVIENQLLDQGFVWLILLTLLAAGGYAIARGIECRARIYEILFWFLIVPLLIMLAVAAKDINPDYWLPVFACGWKNFLLGSAVCFGVFLTGLLSLCILPFCSEPERAGKAACRTVFYCSFLDIALYMILLGIFQPALLAKLKYPAISLTAMAQIPGGLFERQDALMTAVWFFSLFALFNSFIFYGVLQTGRIIPARNSGEKQKKGLRTICVLVVMLICAIACLLGGCSLKEPEKRFYPLAIGIQLAQNNSDFYDISYAWPLLSPEEGNKNAASADEMKTVQAVSLFQSQQQLSEQSDRTADFNHLKALVLDDSLLLREDRLQELLSYFLENENVAWDTCVFAAEDTANMFDDNIKTDSPLGIYLENLVSERDDLRNGSIATVKSLMSQYAGKNETILIPLLSVQDGKPLITSWRIFGFMQDHGSISEEEEWMARILLEQAKTVQLTMDDRTSITLSDLQVKREFQMKRREDGEDVPVQKIQINATLRAAGGREILIGRRKEITEAAQKQITDDLNRFLIECENKNADISGSFLKLSGYNREIWKLYRDNPDVYAKQLHTSVDVKLKLLTS